MADRTARILIGVESDTASAQQGIAAVSTSVDNLATKVEQVASSDVARRFGDMPEPLRQSFIRAEQEAENFQRRLEAGAVTGPRDLKKVTIAQTLLNLEIEKAGKELKDLGPDAERAFGRLEKAQKDAIVATSRIKQELDDVNVQTTTGTRGFTGFGNAVEAMGGKAAGAAEQLGFIAGAFTAGIAAGNQFNQMVGTDMSEFDEQMALLGMRLKETMEGIADSIVGMGGVVAALVAGDWEELKRSSEDVKAGFSKVADSVSATNDQLRAQRDEAAAAAEAQKKAAEAVDAKAEADKKAEEAAKKYNEEQKKQVALYLEQERTAKQAAIAAEALVMEMEKEAGLADAASVAFDRASIALADSEGKHRVLEANVRNVAAALEEARSRAAALADEYGSDSAAAKNAATEVGHLEQSLARTQQQTERAAKAVEANSEEQDKAAQAIEQHAQRLADLKSGQEKVTVSADAAAEASRRLATAGQNATAGLLSWSSSASAVQGNLSNLAAVAAQSAQPFQQIGLGLGATAKALQDADPAMHNILKNISSVNTEMVTLIANTRIAAGELKKLGEVE